MNVTAETPPRVAIVSLGCAKNLVDSEHIASLLEKAGVEVVTDPTDAPVVIVNSCGFIDIAKEESIDSVLEIADLKTEGNLRRLILTGCLSERYGQELRESLPEADVMLGIDPHGAARAALWALGMKCPLPSQCNMRAVRFTPPWWSYLRISEGCDNCCSYCAIPNIRGPLVSRPHEDILAEARQLVNEGARELNLIAQDTTAYQHDHGQQGLHKLLDDLCHLENQPWIRLLYTHPAHYYTELIDVLAEQEAICPYLDIPLQHVSDPILKRMERGVTKARIADLISTLRDRIPDLTLRTTFMVGFPGETEEQFQEILDFAEEIEFERIGGFKYSREEDTPASTFDAPVPEEVKESRYERLMELQQTIMRHKARERVGETTEVLIEGYREDIPVGRSAAEAPDVDPLIFFDEADSLHEGALVRAEIVDSIEYDTIASVREVIRDGE
ncbi:MAG: 30S ribosomal protein S12 methylthiotransferase RimO [Planctomycetota bacterium]